MLIACPTCGRLQFDMDTVVAEIEQRLERYEEPDRGRRARLRGQRDRRGVPRRLRHRRRQERGPDLRPRQAAAEGPAGGPGRHALRRDRHVRWTAARSSSTSGEAAEGAEWLAKIEEENADDLTPERIAAMEAAAAQAEGKDVDRRALPEAGEGPQGRRSTRKPRRRQAAASPAPSSRPAQRRDGPAIRRTMTSRSTEPPMAMSQVPRSKKWWISPMSRRVAM